MVPSVRLLAVILVLGLAGAPRAEKPGAKPIKPTVAVLYFDYGGKKAELEPLRDGLAQMLITDLAELPEIRVVERARLKAILEEHGLAASGKVDTASAARVGKLLGARDLVLGSYFDLAGTLRIDARVVEVETGKVVRSVGVNGPAADFWGLEHDLAAKLADTMRTALPATFEHAAQLAPKPRPPKMAAATAVTYGRALAAADAGKKAEARGLLTKVVEEAPAFKLAKQDLNALLTP
ncbi:MAG TPA: CsgG/HfaB family protein [Polyangia bacterium]